MYKYWAPVAAASRGFKTVLFTVSHRNNFVGGKCALPSAILVIITVIVVSEHYVMNSVLLRLLLHILFVCL